MRRAWSVYCKELVDALRDGRTLLVVLIGSVAMGPLVLVLLSSLVGGIERRAEARELVVVGIEHAPTLRNYLERQDHRVLPAPADHEKRLEDGSLVHPVIVIGADFESELAAARQPLVEVLTSAGNSRAQSATPRVVALLAGFNREQALLRLATRGVAPAVLEPMQVEERDLADPATRGAQFTALVPFFVLMAVLYGALNAALDTTAGERERGSLEPLLATPAPAVALVLGKWAAVATLGMGVAVLACLSFLPGQWLLRSETLAALFRFGPREALLFLALLLPLAMALSALLMAVAIRCRSVKEAQANATLVVLAASLLPLVTVFNPGGERGWQLAVPALAQTVLMGRVLKGGGLDAADLAVPLVVCLLLTVAGVAYVARALRRAALD